MSGHADLPREAAVDTSVVVRFPPELDMQLFVRERIVADPRAAHFVDRALSVGDQVVWIGVELVP